MSQNLGSLPPLSHNVNPLRPPFPCDVIYGCPLTYRPIWYWVTSSMEFSAPTPITAMPLIRYTSYLQMNFIDLTEWQDSTLKVFDRIGE